MAWRVSYFSQIAHNVSRNSPSPFADPCQPLGNKIMAHREMMMILIADDDLDFAENCSMMLESHGYDVNVVSDGVEALKRIREKQPELIISDCSMPNMGGLQLSEEVKARPADAQCPVLLMSGSLKCRVAPGTSYDGFLRKPFLAEDLLLEVRKLIADHVSATQNKKGNV